jgi:small neutral amino acid transporter SnatA (MarC family)
MSFSTIPRIFLTLGLMSELVGVMLIIYIRFPSKHARKSQQKLIHIASEVPTFLILIGIVGIAAALVVEMLDISVGNAVAMGGILLLGIAFCVLAWCFGMGGKAMMLDPT